MNVVKYFYGVALNLGSLSIILITAGGVGSALLRRHVFHSPAEKISFSLSIGLGACALFIYVLGLLGILHPKLILILTICAALLTLYCKLLKYRKLASSIIGQRDALTRLYKPVTSIVAIIVFFYCLALMSLAFFPPIHWDALQHHLVICRESLELHRLAVVQGIPQPVLPLLNHMLFIWGMAIKDDIVAQMVEYAVMMVSVLGIYAWGQRQGNVLVGITAAAFWLAHPVVLLLVGAAYVDVAVSVFAFQGIYALRVFYDERSDSWWYLAISLLSMAAGIKIPGLFFLGFGVALTGLIAMKARVISYQSIIKGYILAALIVIPWYAWIYYHTGNPLWPLLPQLSRPEWGGVASTSLLNVKAGIQGYKAGMGSGFSSLLFSPFNIVLYPQAFNGVEGLTFFPLISVWPLGLLVSWWDRNVRWWTLWLSAYTIFWFFAVQEMRFWFPGAIIAGLVICESIRFLFERISMKAVVRQSVWIALTGCCLIYGLLFVTGRLKVLDLVPPLTGQERDAFYEKYKAGYRAITYINEHADNNDKVFVAAYAYVNYFFRRKLIGMFLGYGHVSTPVPKFRLPDDLAWINWLRKNDVKWIYVNRLEMPDLNAVIKTDHQGQYFWPGYRVVYSDQWAFVFKQTND